MRSHLPILFMLAVSTGCCSRSTSPPPSCPSPPPVTIDPPRALVDCRTVLSPPLTQELAAKLQALPRCLTAQGQPTSSGEPCWNAGEVDLAAGVLAQYVMDDARVRRCLELAADAAP